MERMPSARIVLGGLSLLVFAAAAMAVTLSHRDGPRQTGSPEPRPPSTLAGKLSIHAIDDFRVAGRRIFLCGVSYQKPASMRSLYLNSARRELEGQEVTCTVVGGGTPCDGHAASTFGGIAVVQCHNGEGMDIAADLAKKGILCDLPGQSAGHYQAC
jgi:hypothetical protein